MNKWIFIFLFSANYVNGQHVKLQPDESIPIYLSPDFSLFIPQQDYQYVASKWASGRLFYTNGTSKRYDSLNFDRYSNKIEVVINNKALSILPMGLTGALIYFSDKVGYLLIVGKVKDQPKFLAVESVGQYVLAAYLISSAPKEDLTYKTDEIRFVPKIKKEDLIKKTFWLLTNGIWAEFKMNKSTVSKLFKIDKKKLQSIASDKGINVNNKHELVRLFQFLNDN